MFFALAFPRHNSSESIISLCWLLCYDSCRRSIILSPTFLISQLLGFKFEFKNKYFFFFWETLTRNFHIETLLPPLWLTLPFIHQLNHKKKVGKIHHGNIQVIFLTCCLDSRCLLIRSGDIHSVNYTTW